MTDLTVRLDETHNPALRSWVESASRAGHDFPIQNLPFGVFKLPGDERARIGIAIGDEILDCLSSARAGLFEDLEPAIRESLRTPTLNALMSFGREGARSVRSAASRLLRTDSAEGAHAQAIRGDILVAADSVELLLPAMIGDYTDFYASVVHATNIGSMFRPESPLLPNYKWIPIGYHGRSSSLVVSGTPVNRPFGQTRSNADASPVYGSSRNLDYEVELGAFVCGENRIGERVPLANAEERLFGLCLLNDWSARDVQSWEYQPLGPFLGKNFTTSISPWVVTLDALEPYRCAAFARPADDPSPLPYLADARDQALGGFQVELELWLTTAQMRADGAEAVRLSRAQFQSMYWTFAQMLTHHASNGCNLRPGDLLGSGTISGPAKSERGSMMELAWRGTEPVVLPNGEARTFLADGDEVVMRGWCAREGAVRIGFGECRGEVRAAE